MSRQSPRSSRSPRPISAAAPNCEGEVIAVDYVINALIALALATYLLYALLRPEKF